MLEEYIYNLVTEDTDLQNLLDDGDGDYHIYPGVVPEKVQIETAVAYTVIGSVDEFPNITSKQVQFNIFSKSHKTANEVSQALFDLFNQDILHTSGDISIDFSIRQGENDLGFDFDVELYQRATTFNFILS